MHIHPYCYTHILDIPDNSGSEFGIPSPQFGNTITPVGKPKKLREIRLKLNLPKVGLRSSLGQQPLSTFHPKIIQLIIHCFATLWLAIAPVAQALDVALNFGVPEDHLTHKNSGNAEPSATQPNNEIWRSKDRDELPTTLYTDNESHLQMGSVFAQSNAHYPPPPENSSTSATQLFATIQSPGSIAVGVAEGNLTANGEATRQYSGHKDPGNSALNRGFCSWNGAQNLTVSQADQRCLASLKRQSIDTEKKLQRLGIDLKNNAEILVNGTDLSNQSPRAGADFAEKYKQALEKKLSPEQTLIDARVEAFRNESGELSASGLFRICRDYAYYREQLQGLEPYSEAWRWQCIALDQGRRVRAVNKALELNLLPNEIGHRKQSPESFKSDTNSAIFDTHLLNFEPETSSQPEQSLTSPVESDPALDFRVASTY